MQFQSSLKTYLQGVKYPGQNKQRHMVAAAIQKTHIHQAAKYVTMQGDLVRVRATKKFGTSQQPWFDCAIVQFDASDDPESEVLQLGYVKTCILFEVLGTHYMFVRWLTSAQLGSSITNRGNEFESHHIRNLPRLKWNMRTQTCNKSYQVMPVSLLRKGAWVHPDFRDASILWHIKSTQFYMHQDPEQAMGTVAGGNK